jgi:hypothetical protein
MDFVALPVEPKKFRTPLEKWKLSLRPCTSIAPLEVPFAQLGWGRNALFACFVYLNVMEF